MAEASPSDDDRCAAQVTALLNQSGDAQASADLLPLVYQRLRALAEQRMRGERAGQTLQATALVHEAYVRLVDRSRVQNWRNRWHFFAAAAEAMRRILIEGARRRGRIKRGGQAQRVDLDSDVITVHDPPDQLLELDEALQRLAEAHPDKAKLVSLRYFGGLSHEEAAEAMGISLSTADRHWAYARAWLYRQMSS